MNFGGIYMYIKQIWTNQEELVKWETLDLHIAKA